MSAYLDTSALAKLYLSEPGSEAFAGFVSRCDRPRISTLVVAEMRSLLQRHRRLGSIDDTYARDAFDLLLADIEERRLVRFAIHDEDLWGATHLMGSMPSTPLRTLDAIHLAACQARRIRLLATADTRMAEAARSLGMDVETF